MQIPPHPRAGNTRVNLFFVAFHKWSSYPDTDFWRATSRRFPQVKCTSLAHTHAALKGVHVHESNKQGHSVSSRWAAAGSGSAGHRRLRHCAINSGWLSSKASCRGASQGRTKKFRLLISFKRLAFTQLATRQNLLSLTHARTQVQCHFRRVHCFYTKSVVAAWK